MIIDIHAHFVTAPLELAAYRSRQIQTLNKPVKGKLNVSDERLREALQPQRGRIEAYGTDLVLFSPQASAMAHYFGSERVSRYWTETNNELIARVCGLYPEQFIGVCQLPQFPGVSPKNCLAELERCVNEFGFVGCNLNPDPAGGAAWTPSLGDEWWYPLYEKLVELDVPAMIHASATQDPALHLNASHYINVDTAAVVEILNSSVFKQFPTLKLVIPHGGGAIPYQLGRLRALNMSRGEAPFEQTLKQLYFDTALYTKDSMELLITVAGVDNVLFATEMLGTANAIDPANGRWCDDTKPYLDAIDWLSDEDRRKIFEGNARRVYSRLPPVQKGAA